MKKNLALLALLLVVASGALMAQTAEDVLAKSMKALSYKDMSQKSTYMEAVMKMSMQGMDMTMNMKTWSKPVKKARAETEVMGSKIIFVSDGVKYYMLNPMGGSSEFQEVDEATFEKMQQQSNMNGYGIFDYKQNGGKVKFIGKTKCGKDDCYEIEFTGKDGQSTNYFFDAKSYLISKMRVNSPQGAIDIAMTDYRPEGGVLTPHKMTGTLDGSQVMSVEITKIDYNANIDDSLFKPEVK